MRFVRGLLVVGATLLLVVGDMIPAPAQSADVCGPHTSAPCDEPEVLEDSGETEVLDAALELTPKTSDVVVSVDDDTSVLSIVLVCAGMDAWLLAVVGALAIGAGVVALCMRPETTDATL